MATRKVPELSGIEFNGHKSMVEYSKVLREILRDLAHETDFAGEEVRAVLSSQSGHPLLFGVDVRLRARKVAKRLHRVSELAAGGAIEAVKFYTEFRLQFGEALNPDRRPRGREFDFND